MTIKKPYRICNHPLPETTQIPTVHPDGTTAFIKEKKEQYELRIHLADHKKQGYSIAICDGVLYMWDSMDAHPSSERNIIARFPLPANVMQDKIQAAYRPYGIKILMPKVPSNGVVIQVPIK